MQIKVDIREHTLIKLLKALNNDYKFNFDILFIKTRRFKNYKLTVLVIILSDKIHDEVRRKLNRAEVAKSLGKSSGFQGENRHKKTQI